MSHHMTNSERSSFETCRHKHLIQDVLGARPDRVSKALELGAIFHEALYTWWRYWSTGARPLEASSAKLTSEFDRLASRLPTGFTTSSRYDHMTRDGWEESRRKYTEILARYHERHKNQRLELVMNEEVLSCSVLTSSGNPSTRTGLAGKVDKVIKDEHGQHWIMDHKTTSRSLVDWRERHAYSPQLAQYAVMLIRQGIRPVGVVYDLVLKAVPPKPQEYKVLKSGDRLSKVLPRYTDADSYMAALRYWQLDPEEPSHAETYLRLKGQQDLFFRREWIRFTRFELERAEQELYTVATDVRRQHDKGADLKERLRATHDIDAWRHELASIARERGGEFPRSTGSCYRYSRACPLMAFCERPSFDTALDLVPYQRDYTTALGLVDDVSPAFTRGGQDGDHVD